MASQHHRRVRQFIPVAALRRKMLDQMLCDSLHATHHTALEVRLPEGCLHLMAYLAPFLGIHLGVNAAIGDDFHGPIREQEVDQHACGPALRGSAKWR